MIDNCLINENITGKNMKRKMIYTLLPCLIFINGCVFAQEAKQIIAKHIKAIGGLKAINKQQALHTVGEMESAFMGKASIEMWTIRNKGFRVDISANDTTRSSVMYDHYSWKEVKPGKTSASTKIPDAAWNALDLDITGEIVEYEKKGNIVMYAGKELIDGKECFKIKLTNKLGRTTYYFIETKTYFIVQSKVFHVDSGKEVDDGTSRFGDYRKTDIKVVLPYLLMQVSNDKVMFTTKILSHEINMQIAESVFKRPEE